MHVPGAPSFLFLVYLLLILPWAAIKSARRVHGASTDKPLPSRKTIWLSTTLMLAGLFALAWFVGRGFDFEIFALPAHGARELGAALVALLLLLVLRKLLRASRSEEERKRLAVYKLAPRSTDEWILWYATVIVASIAEEAAYRGVGMAILWYSLGNPWIAALVCSLAFAAAHWMQGRKSGVAIFAIALVMHALVAFTQTLVFAMIVHAIYDCFAGWLIHRQRLADEAQRASSSAQA